MVLWRERLFVALNLLSTALLYTKELAIGAACALPAGAGHSAEGALLASTWCGVHDQQEQEDGEDAHGATSPA
jgi:hypothetical protein